VQTIRANILLNGHTHVHYLLFSAAPASGWIAFGANLQTSVHLHPTRHQFSLCERLFRWSWCVHSLWWMRCVLSAIANKMFIFRILSNYLGVSLYHIDPIIVNHNFNTLKLNLFSFSHKNKLNYLTLHSYKQHVLSSPYNDQWSIIVQTSDQKFTFSIKNNDIIQFISVFIYKLWRLLSPIAFTSIGLKFSA
jgi:hypothetical protein